MDVRCISRQESSTVPVVGSEAIVDVKVRQPVRVGDFQARKSAGVDQRLHLVQRGRIDRLTTRRQTRADQPPPAREHREDEQIPFIMQKGVADLVF
jgi:hypothetical protein